MTERDHHILDDIARYHYLTAAQVARLHFGRQHKLAQRRLRILTQAGLVRRFHPPEATRAGFRTWWYCLTRAGARHVSEPRVIVPTRPPATLGFLAHHTQTVDFLVWLREACNASDGFSHRLLTDAALAIPGRRRIIPDATILLAKGERQALCCLELDRATEPLRGTHQNALTRKLTAYRAAYDARAEHALAEQCGAPLTGFRVLIVTSDDTRPARIVALAEQLDLAPLVWVTTSALTQEPGKLDARAWRVRPGEDQHALTE